MFTIGLVIAMFVAFAGAVAYADIANTLDEKKRNK
jgi:hypothetical protein